MINVSQIRKTPSLDCQGLRFNGTTQYASAEHSSSLLFTGELTIEWWGWIQENSNETYDVLIEKINDDWGLYVSNGNTPAFYCDGFPLSYGTESLTVGGYCNLGNLITFVYSSSGSYAKMYVNGVLSGTDNQIGNILNSSDKLMIGGNSGDGWIKQGVKEIRLYNRALQGAEILANYNSGDVILGDSSGLKARYIFQNGQNSNDFSGNGNTLTFVNF